MMSITQKTDTVHASTVMPYGQVDKENTEDQRNESKPALPQRPQVDAKNITTRSVTTDTTDMMDIRNAATETAKTMRLLRGSLEACYLDADEIQIDFQDISENRCSLPTNINLITDLNKLIKEVQQLKREHSLIKKTIQSEKEKINQLSTKHQGTEHDKSISNLKRNFEDCTGRLLKADVAQTKKILTIEKRIKEKANKIANEYVSKILLDINNNLSDFTCDTRIEDDDILALKLKQKLATALKQVPTFLLSNSMLAKIDQVEKFIDQQLLESTKDEPNSDMLTLEAFNKELPLYIKKLNSAKSAIGTGKSHTQNMQKLDAVLKQIINAQCSLTLSSSESLMTFINNEEQDLIKAFKKLRGEVISKKFTKADFIKKKGLLIKTRLKGINRNTPKAERDLLKQRLTELIALGKEEVKSTSCSSVSFKKQILEFENFIS